MPMIEIIKYVAEHNWCPFDIWLDGLRDPRAKAQIQVRLNRLQLGNEGHWKSVGEGVRELKIPIGKAIGFIMVGRAKRSFYYCVVVINPHRKKTLLKPNNIGVITMSKAKTYKTSDYLKTNEDRAEYLKAIIAENDEGMLMLAIREIIDSMGGIGDIMDTHINFLQKIYYHFNFIEKINILFFLIMILYK